MAMVRYAQKLIGKPYEYGGKDPRGFDCSGFTFYVMKAFDIHLPPVSSRQAELGDKITKEEVKPGDLVFFKRTSGDKVFHVAMVSEKNGNSLYVIHSTSRGVVTDEIYSSKFWSPKIDSYQRFISE